MPTLSGLKVSPSRFTTKKGARVRFTLDAPAKVAFSVQRIGARNRIRTLRGTFTRAGKAGANRFTFHGRLAGHTLAPGRYRLRATPAGGATRRASFRIVRR